MSDYDLRECSLAEVRELCRAHHGYGSAGGIATYSFAVYEAGRPVAAYAWQPPPPGAALAVCPEAPAGVLSLSRMVAVPRAERLLNHVSRPLRRQMHTLIDRGRWPVLVTYHDEGQGHTGHVYKCSGWELSGGGRERSVYVDDDGHRASRYSNGVSGGRALTGAGKTRLHRWEHWACERGDAANWMAKNGWTRVTIAGRTWRSGKPACRWVNASQDAQVPLFADWSRDA